MSVTKDKRVGLIESGRRFGIEIEAGNEDRGYLDDVQNMIGGFVHTRGDSSIKAPNGVEFVTNVLQGRNGAKKLIQLCDALQENHFITDDPSCGMHLHLDAPEFLNKQEVVVVKGDGIQGFLTDRLNDLKRLIFLDKRVAKHLGRTKVDNEKHYRRFADEYLPPLFKGEFSRLDYYMGDDHTYVRKGVMPVDGGKTVPIEEIGVVDGDDLTIANAYTNKEIKSLTALMDEDMRRGEPKERQAAKMLFKEKKTLIQEKLQHKLEKMFKLDDGRYIAMLNDRVPLNRVKALMYFYVGFNEVFQGMVAPSRRIGNAYCMPIADFFDLDRIEALDSYEQFESLWYKEGDPVKIQGYKGDHYNDSRYLDVNLHSLFNRTNTIELRVHGSTKDASQILMWTALHQYLVDKIATDAITWEMVRDSLQDAEGVEGKYRAMVELVGLPEHLSEYVKRLLVHFSNLKIK